MTYLISQSLWLSNLITLFEVNIQLTVIAWAFFFIYAFFKVHPGAYSSRGQRAGGEHLHSLNH